MSRASSKSSQVSNIFIFPHFYLFHVLFIIELVHLTLHALMHAFILLCGKSQSKQKKRP